MKNTICIVSIADVPDFLRNNIMIQGKNLLLVSGTQTATVPVGSTIAYKAIGNTYKVWVID